jgi:hypothetical protein
VELAAAREELGLERRCRGGCCLVALRRPRAPLGEGEGEGENGVAARRGRIHVGLPLAAPPLPLSKEGVDVGRGPHGSAAHPLQVDGPVRLLPDGRAAVLPCGRGLGGREEIGDLFHVDLDVLRSEAPGPPPGLVVAAHGGEPHKELLAHARNDPGAQGQPGSEAAGVSTSLGSGGNGAPAHRICRRAPLTFHCKSLAAARLAVGEDSSVVPLEHLPEDPLRRRRVGVGLAGVLRQHRVEREGPVLGRRLVLPSGVVQNREGGGARDSHNALGARLARDGGPDAHDDTDGGGDGRVGGAGGGRRRGAAAAGGRGVVVLEADGGGHRRR